MGESSIDTCPDCTAEGYPPAEVALIDKYQFDTDWYGTLRYGKCPLCRVNYVFWGGEWTQAIGQDEGDA